MGKRTNGISLRRLAIILFCVALVIIIIVMQNIKTKKIEKLTLQINLLNQIQEKVYDLRDEYVLWEDYDPNLQGNFYEYLKQYEFKNANTESINPYVEDFKKILSQMNENKKIEYFNYNVDSNLANYFYFDSNEIKKKFDLEIDDDMFLIINFYTGNIVLKDPMDDVNKKQKIYREYDSSIGEKLKINEVFEDLDLKMEVTKNEGLKQNVKITFPKNEKVSIKETYYYTGTDSENKINCSNLDNYIVNLKTNEISFTITKSGDYTFVVCDRNGIDYKRIEKTFALVNPPELLDGMTGIYFDEYGNEQEIKNQFDKDWYDYSKNRLRMANAKMPDGNYYVWIPRYKYKENPDGTISIEYLENESNIPTSMNSALKYEIQESFKEASKGFWVGKFISGSNESLVIKPGLLYSSVLSKEAEEISQNYLGDNSLYASKLMSKFNVSAILNISKLSNITIDDKTEIYTGGIKDTEDFRKKISYSSSGNMSGVYDLKNIAYELLLDENVTTNGGFRNILYKK